MATTNQPRDHLTPLPPEIKLEIFSHLPSATAAHNLSMASRDFRGVLTCHYDAIVRSLVDRAISPQCVKLAFMVIESRSVDSTNGESIKKFFDSYMNQDGLEDGQLSLRVVHEMIAVHRAIVSLKQDASASMPSSPICAPNDHMRVVQTYHVLEIFSNLYDASKGSPTASEPDFGKFNPLPGPTRVNLFAWPCTFWGHFARDELQIVLKVAHALSWHYSTGGNFP
ncbi:hypothetical protein PG993_004032 [Apiospora rasikravindrae]|uniref:F-box domain-containing protein n=1 Tax=Apiospora rasikravindrae TaxID=990691 RepID=A0ABR1TBL9_9PEZI